MWNAVSSRILAVYSWAGLVASMLVLTPLNLFCSFLDRSGAASHQVISLWCRTVLFFVRSRLIVDGLEELDHQQNYIMASNHEGFGDIPALGSALPMQFKFVAKRMLFSIPCLGLNMRAGRNIPIDRGEGPQKNQQSFDRMERALADGFSIMMFPEGSRTRDGELMPFKSGTFRLALRTGKPILPMALAGSRAALPADDWIIRASNAVLKVGRPIPVAHLPNTEESVEVLKKMCREQIAVLRDEAFAIKAALERYPELAPDF